MTIILEIRMINRDTKIEDLNRKIQYWLDKKLSKGMINVFKLLTMSVLGVVVFIAVLISLFNLKDNFFKALWDSLATTINAYVPSSDDGSAGYIILNTVTAVVGLLFSSILIGMISSAIEEKIRNLRKGNLVVLEQDHYVILGYNHGEHGLIKQIIQNGEKGRKCIVILTDLEKPEIEDDISNSLKIERNVEIICRHGDITRINDLRICSIDKAKVIIINAIDDTRRVKAILAISALKKEYPDSKARIITCISDHKNLLPKEMLKENNIIMLQTNNVMASIIAQSSFEPGISSTFNELLNYEGNDFYFEKNIRFTNKSISQITVSLIDALVLGIKRGNKLVLNPNKETTVELGDELLLIEESLGTYKIIESTTFDTNTRIIEGDNKINKESTVIFGSNILLKSIVRIITDKSNITLVGNKEDEQLELVLKQNRDIQFYDYDSVIDNKERISNILKGVKHVIILADRDIPWEDADIKTSLLLLKLEDIKRNNNYEYNIVSELIKENSYNYVPKGIGYDYVITSAISSLVLAQIADKPMLRDVFIELLSPNGNNLIYKTPDEFGINNEGYYVTELKQITLTYGFVFLGYSHNNKTILNPTDRGKLNFGSNDKLILLGK